jgi:hypothetical protein
MKAGISAGIGSHLQLRDWKFLACALAGLAIVLLAFQQWPGMSATTHESLSDTGYAQCLTNGWRQWMAGCSANIGQPFGGVHVFGLPTVALAAALFGWDGAVSFSEMHFIIAAFTVIAFCGAVAFFRRLSGSAWIGLLGAVLYLLSPIVSQQGAYGALRTGYALLPLYLLVDGLLLTLGRRTWRMRGVIVALVVLVRVFAVLCDGYSFVMSSGLALSLFLVSGLVSRRVGPAAIAIGTYVLACAVAYVSYFWFVPGGQSGLGTMPIDFFRGQGVDLYTVLVPSQWFWIYKAAGLAFDFPAAAAFGDGSNVGFNFAGYAFLLSAAVVLVARVFRGRKLGALLASLALSALVAFLLSLGPSLKYRSLDPTRADASVQFSTYLMPQDKAVASLGTDAIYLHVPGVRNIRVLARWQAVVHLALVGFLVVLLALLIARRQRGIAAILVVAALFESAPNLAVAYRAGLQKRAEAEAIRDEYLPELLSMTQPRERAVLVQLHEDAESNHYAVDYLCPKADLRCYNTGGDKALEIVRGTWPQEIEELLVGRNVGFNIRQLFRAHQADVVLVPLFDLRRLAYSRGAARVDTAAVRRRVDEITAGGGYRRVEGIHFISLRPADALLQDHECGMDCWQQWPAVAAIGRIIDWGPQAGVRGEGFNRQINGRSALWVRVTDDPNRYIVAFGGALLPTFSASGAVTAIMPERFESGLQASRSYNVALVDIVDSRQIPLGKFEVLAPPVSQNP